MIFIPKTLWICTKEDEHGVNEKMKEVRSVQHE